MLDQHEESSGGLGEGGGGEGCGGEGEGGGGEGGGGEGGGGLRKRATVDPSPPPVMPGMHYAMGGVKADIDGKTAVPGLYAAGEVACISVHGGNRLGANSLLDTLVFGRRSGIHAAEMVKSVKHLSIDDSAAQDDINQINQLLSNEKNESFGKVRLDMGTGMKKHLGVYRDQSSMEKALELVKDENTII